MRQFGNLLDVAKKVRHPTDKIARRDGNHHDSNVEEFCKTLHFGKQLGASSRESIEQVEHRAEVEHRTGGKAHDDVDAENFKQDSRIDLI